jgi:hypothetical protein
MRLRGEYDAVQDRIVLTLWEAAVSGGNHLLWVTRRQWLAIAAACYRARSSAALEGEQPVIPRKKAAGPEGQAGFGGATPGPIGIHQMADGTGDYGVGGGESVKVSLVSSVKFQRVPSGLRIKVTTEAGVPLFLPLKGENFPLFIKLVERLAAKAKWDLPAAITRMKNGVPVQKEFVN